MSEHVCVCLLGGASVQNHDCMIHAHVTSFKCATIDVGFMGLLQNQQESMQEESMCLFQNMRLIPKCT